MENLNNGKGASKNLLFTSFRQNTYHNLCKKYSSGNYSYDKIAIHYILFNKSSLVVAKFKDYLIYDDNAEFILNYYSNENHFERLKKILSIYEQYSKIFPNYLVFKENKYMYRNIRKKQKMIDQVNRIKEEEEENREKMKNDGINNEEDNKIFTNSVKEEIKKFIKNTTFRNHKNSLDISDNKDNTFLNCSFSLKNLLNKKKFNNNLNNIISRRKSFDSIWTEETNGTLSNLVNIMKDNKIPIKNLHHILSIKPNNDNSNTVIKNVMKNNNNINKNEHKLKFVNKFKYLDYMIDSNKKIKNKASKNHGALLKKNILSMNKNKEEVTGKIKNYLTSTLLSTKKVNKMHPSLNIFNSNSIIEKSVTHKQNLILPLKTEKINKRCIYHSPTQTARGDQSSSKISLTNNLNSNSKSKYSNTSKEKKNQKYIYHHIKSKSKNANCMKSKHITHDFTLIKQLDKKHKHINSYSNSIKNHRELSPQLKLESNPKYYTSRILKDLKNKKTIKSSNNKSKLNIKSNKANSKLNKNFTKNKDFIKKNIIKKIKEIKEIDKLKSNDIKLLKTNIKNIYSKSKFNISEYLLTFINRLKTESDINNKTIQKEKGNKRFYFHYVQKSNTKNNKGKKQISEEKKMTSISKSKSKSKSKDKEKNKDKEIVKKKISQHIKKLVSGYTKTNLKTKHRKISSIACPSIKNISNYYINKDYKDSINNFNYTTINTKNNIILTSNRTNNESNDLKVSSKSKGKNLFLNMNTIKKKTIIKSPFSSLNIMKENKNNKNYKKIYNLKEKSQICLTNNFINNKNNHSINRSDTKEKYKKYLKRKNIKKSCDLNQEFKDKDKSKSKINILNKINTINTNNLYLSIFENNSNSIDTNHFKKNSDFYTNEFSLQIKKKDNFNNINNNNCKKEKDKMFKKVMCLKINNLKRKKEGKNVKNTIIKSDNNLPPLSLRIDSSNILSKYKAK